MGSRHAKSAPYAKTIFFAFPATIAARDAHSTRVGVHKSPALATSPKEQPHDDMLTIAIHTDLFEGLYADATLYELVKTYSRHNALHVSMRDIRNVTYHDFVMDWDLPLKWLPLTTKRDPLILVIKDDALRLTLL